MREQPDISEERLRACLQEQYALLPATVEFLPLGLDYSAGVYRVVSEDGTSYALKVTSRPFYEASFLVPAYLKSQGIVSIMAPLPTWENVLWTRLENWTVVVYPFIDGDTSWTGMTDEHWQEVGETFRQIHEVVLPAHGFESLRRETFDPTEYTQQVNVLETRYIFAQAGDAPQRALCSSWAAHQSTIHRIVTILERLAAVLQKQSGPYVICHADLHPANLLRDRAGHVFVLDWDEVMLAPKERDFLFVGEPPAAGPAGRAIPPFFQGYGPVQVDWTALTYYLYERVIQDLTVCAQDMFLKDDLGEESRADIAQLFQDVLAQGGEIDTAHAVAAHLPSDLGNF